MLLVDIETTRRRNRWRLIVGHKEKIDGLITAFDRVVHKDHFNPDCVGCPGRTALTALAKEPGTLGSVSLLEHIRNCAACLDDLRELRLATKRS
jgi:hypothetical protein